MMEQIANNGNGNYEYIDNAEQMQKIFVYEKSKFFTVAKDCKVQVTFNGSMVDSYRLIGYENRALSNEDFENDSTDAGEIGASQTITALYEVLLKAGTGEPYANLDVRYKIPGETQSRLLNHKIQTQPKSINEASENMRFAASVAGLGLILKESGYKGTATTQMIINLANSALTFDPNGYRKEFIALAKKAN
jgi:Ca-activated chloride channel family protein